eukprot:TRINITY_DN19357_c0_g1::TRINITY_DN19357_c0_g1_i1::g.7841::m.7841 TRINITY_DN19357_c0_g1::TRINITY_DN19357_c0_g1_i1::g.7841  ORF type:complete len:227 (+),score=50.53,DUF1762/PF08574.5/1e-07,DUF1762/PF08574.5/1.5e+04 TRINITY_DN19357_c0_g1_i1:365-1045(+)
MRRVFMRAHSVWQAKSKQDREAQINARRNVNENTPISDTSVHAAHDVHGSDGAELEYCQFVDLIQVEQKSKRANTRGMQPEPGTSSITLNNRPMKIVSPAVNVLPAGGVQSELEVVPEDDEYVYDMYYRYRDKDTVTGDIDSIPWVSIENKDQLYDYELSSDSDSDAYADDNDDPNDECNWRNDYPDEDSSGSSADEDYVYERRKGFGDDDDDDDDYNYTAYDSDD